MTRPGSSLARSALAEQDEMRNIRNHFDIRNNSKISREYLEREEDETRNEKKLNYIDAKLDRKCYKLQFK